MTRRAFLWGKLPAHGDFIARGLAGDERDALDQWLSTALQEARDELGDAFEQRYDEAPPWRFVEGGEEVTAGAMAPSMDQVGRRYPIMVAVGGLAQADAEATAERCEDAIYAALEGGWTADRLVEEIAALPTSAGEGGEGGTTAGWYTLGGEHYPPDRIEAARPSGLMLRILARTAGAAA